MFLLAELDQAFVLVQQQSQSTNDSMIPKFPNLSADELDGSAPPKLLSNHETPVDQHIMDPNLPSFSLPSLPPTTETTSMTTLECGDVGGASGGTMTMDS